jgi:hypothetical protein
MFPLLAVLLAGVHFLLNRSIVDVGLSLFINLGFLILQLVLLTVYFSIKGKKLINITVQLFGLGDVLFLFSIAFYLSVLNFLFFYITSLAFILLAWVLVQSFSSSKSKQIPLAGLQAILFSVFLSGDWFWLHLNATNDAWLLNLIHR